MDTKQMIYMYIYIYIYFNLAPKIATLFCDL